MPLEPGRGPVPLSPACSFPPCARPRNPPPRGPAAPRPNPAVQARLPSFSLWLTDLRGPHVSWNRPLPPAVFEQETFSGRINPETPGFPCQGSKPSPIKLFPRSRSLLLHPNRKNWTLGALFELGWISPTLDFAAVSARPFLLLLGPNRSPRWDRRPLLYLPVALASFLVLGVGQTASSPELGLPGHGATAPEAREPAGHRLFPPGWIPVVGSRISAPD